MKIEGRVFNGIAVFFFVITIVYGFWSGFDEPVGFAALLLTFLMAAMVGLYLVLTGRRIDARPEDNPLGEISELAGEQGHYSPWSWWPLPLAGAAALIFLGIAVGWWLWLVGVALGIVATVGWTFEYYIGDHAH